MVQILYVVHFRVDVVFELQVLETADTRWIRVSNSHPYGIQRYWSTSLENTGLPWIDVVGMIRHRLKHHYAEADDPSLTLEIWPSGWFTWANGIPDPLYDYVHFGGLEDGLANHQRPVEVEDLLEEVW